MKSLEQLCNPRESIFEEDYKDTVLDITNLIDGKINARDFFGTNYVTDGMRTLLREGFRRFARRSEKSTFLLTQSMGGGKTHNMIALGLLAQNPELRDEVMGPDYDVDLGKVRVAGFTGRESDAPYGIWGSIAEQLGKRDQFSDYYSPLQAPGQTAWIELLKGEPLLILLDELPPYLRDAKSKTIGDSNLANVTTTALSNLLVAANKGELDNVCIVISSLQATYQEESKEISEVLRTLESEVQRGAVHLEPVSHNTNEIYHILRTRIFEELPEEKEVQEIARGYAEAVEEAKQMDVTSESPETYATRLTESYPFHFSIRDLYSRFRENPGFQQTRDLIRLMRTVIAHTYETGRAEERLLVHPYDVDLNHKPTFSQITQINSSLENAISHDVASGGDAIAEQIDEDRSGRDAQDAATLLLMSSLADVPDAIKGLNRSELITTLCRPDRDISQLWSKVIRPFNNRAWYLHSSSEGRLFFKDVQNLNARLKTTADAYGREARLGELRSFLQDQFEPSLGDVYQRIEVLPPIDEIEIFPEEVTLVIYEPSSGRGLSDDLKALYDSLDYKNRVLFLTGSRESLTNLLEKAARLKAIRYIIDEMKRDNVAENDPQFTSAQEKETEVRLQILSAARETFTTLVYPHGTDGELRTADFFMNFDNNQYNGEEQIRETLKEKQKFVGDTDTDLFRKKCEDRLFTRQEMMWSEIEKRAAAYTQWQWHHPDALERLRQRMVHQDQWRQYGKYVKKPPFPKETTDVKVQRINRDPETGEVTLRLNAIHGDTIYYEVGGTPTPASKKVEDPQSFTSDEMEVSFLCVDEEGEHETGEPVTWENEITVRSRVYQGSGDKKMVEFEPAPDAEIRYTTDGSNPKVAGGAYDGPIGVDSDVQIVQAVAIRDGVESKIHERRIDWDEESTVDVDPVQPVTWRRRRSTNSTQESYSLIRRLKETETEALGARIYVDNGPWVEISFDSSVKLDGDSLEDSVEHARSQLDGGDVTIDVDALHFETGQDFLDWVEEEKVDLAPEEVDQ